VFKEPFPNPDDVLINQYEESLLPILSLKRKGRYIIFAISNRAFNDDEETDEEKGDDGSVREIADVEVIEEMSEFAKEFAAEIGALHLAGAQVSVKWGEIIYWN
jgi:elongation factor P hydroxylase